MKKKTSALNNSFNSQFELEGHNRKGGARNTPVGSSNGSLENSFKMTELSSDEDHALQMIRIQGKQREQSEIQQEISIHESMQKGHEEGIVREISLKPQNDIKIDKLVIAHTIEQFVCEEDKVSFEVYKDLKQKLEASLKS